MLTALAVALCLTVSGGAVAIEHADPATPVLGTGKAKLADAALVKPPLTELPPSVAPEQPAARGASTLALDALTVAAAHPRAAEAPPGAITPAALIGFAGHPTRAGP